MRVNLCDRPGCGRLITIDGYELRSAEIEGERLATFGPVERLELCSPRCLALVALDLNLKHRKREPSAFA